MCRASLASGPVSDSETGGTCDRVGGGWITKAIRPNSKTAAQSSADGTSSNRQPRHSQPTGRFAWIQSSRGPRMKRRSAPRKPEDHLVQQRATIEQCSPPRNKIPKVEVPGGFPVFSARAIARTNGAPPTGNRNEEASADDCDEVRDAGTQCGADESQEEDAGAISEPRDEP